jgi:hypothetical protein
LKFKLIQSLFFIGGYFFFRIIGPIITGKLKEFHIKNNTGLVEKAPFLFKFFSFIFKGASIMCIIFIFMIWAGIVTDETE